MKQTLCLIVAALSTVSVTRAGQNDMLESLQPSIHRAISEFDQIPAERQQELEKIADFVRSKGAVGEPAHLTFICTHNSRRSHLSQIWAQTAALYYGVAQVKAFSGGTEATVCNPRTVAALQRAGFEVTNTTPDRENPVYEVRYSPGAEPIRTYSKKYSSGGNPMEDFVAIMTCSQADQNCPLVMGSVLRMAIPYVDPKVSDGTEAEAATYDERCRQIAREMFFLMAEAKK